MSTTKKKRGGGIKRFIIKAIITAILYAIGLGFLVPWLATFMGCADAGELGTAGMRKPVAPVVADANPASPADADANPSTISFASSSRLTYNATYRIAETTGRPWLILLTASWCEPCQRLKHESISELNRTGWMDGQRFLYTEIDIDNDGDGDAGSGSQSELAKQLDDGSKSVPQIAVFQRVADENNADRRRWIVSRARGFLPMDELRAFLGKAVKR